MGKFLLQISFLNCNVCVFGEEKAPEGITVDTISCFSKKQFDIDNPFFCSNFGRRVCVVSAVISSDGVFM